MGGFGSGRRPYTDRPTCEELPALDVRVLVRHGLTMAGTRAEVEWTCQGQRIGTARIDGGDSQITVSYRFGAPGASQSQHVERISLTCTTPGYGGHQAWFVCPACSRRRAILYLRGEFRCRDCHGLAYQSQRWGKVERLVQRTKRIGGRLDGISVAGDFIPMRPKWMQKRTFERVLENYRDAETSSQEAVVARLGQTRS